MGVAIENANAIIKVFGDNNDAMARVLKNNSLRVSQIQGVNYSLSYLMGSSMGGSHSTPETGATPMDIAVGLNIDFTTLLTEYDANFYLGGDNTMFFGPMSWTIIFGLTFATFLTLVIVPVMYLIFYRFKLRLFKLFKSPMRSNI